MDILDRKRNICVGAKKTWSANTLTAMVPLWLLRLIRCCRNWYHLVAPGPKTAIIQVRVVQYRLNEVRYHECAPPPYNAILPVLA